MSVKEDIIICRLCLDIAGSGFEVINVVTKKILSVLLLEMNFDVSENPVICQKCKETINKCLHFKSTCVNTEKRILSFALNKQETQFSIKDIPRDIQRSYECVDAVNENIRICRLCLGKWESSIFGSNNLIDKFVFMDILVVLMIEMDINIIKDPVICTICIGNLDNYFIFAHKCLGVEDKIKTFCNEENKNIVRVKLTNVLQYFLYKKNTYYFNSYTQLNEFKKEPNEEINSNINETSTTSNANVIYTCSICPYGTKYKHGLKLHMSKHKNPSRITMYKSALATHQAERIDDLNLHTLSSYIHKDTSEIQTYKCSMCIYETKHRNSLTRHILIHERTPNVPMYKCSICAHQTGRKGSLQKHMLLHENSPITKTYRCTICPYETSKKKDLTFHMLVHSEVQMYKCPMCAHVTKYKKSLKTHMLNHKDISEVTMYKCTVCPFETRHKSYLKKHMENHMLIKEN